jgi:phosphatidylglycerol---prolipoprotein diacylglyceryl transferase
MDAHFPHVVLEVTAYAVGATLYRRHGGGVLQPPRRSDRVFLLAGAACGAALGSKGLYVMQYATALAAQPVGVWLAGKTVVGGLLGGWLGVEVAKRAIGWRQSTGDRFVVPFAAALMIGRLGCQLSGPWDLTYGTPTALPWGWDHGDGTPRHPVAAYEILGVAMLVTLLAVRNAARVPGERFRRFVLGYLSLRFVLDFLKPPHGAPAPGAFVADLHAGLTVIQWVCLLGVLVCAASLRRLATARAMAS